MTEDTFYIAQVNFGTKPRTNFEKCVTAEVISEAIENNNLYETLNKLSHNGKFSKKRSSEESKDFLKWANTPAEEVTKMTNAEKYKTAEERNQELNNLCQKHCGNCRKCPAKTRASFNCAFRWLELEAEGGEGMKVKLKYAIKAKGRCDKDWEVLEIVDTMKDARDFVCLSSIQNPLIDYRIVKVK